MMSKATDELDKALNGLIMQYNQRVKINNPKNLDALAKAKTAINLLIDGARVGGYDSNRLGSWVFIGDKARLDNLDDLYWSYVMEEVARSDPRAVENGTYNPNYIKKNMEYASFGGVGLIKMLARADQYAKERIAQLKSDKGLLTITDV